MTARSQGSCRGQPGETGPDDNDAHPVSLPRPPSGWPHRHARGTRPRREPRNSNGTRLNVVACSITKPCAAPEITTSSAWDRSAISSLSPRGVKMSWLPTITSVGTSMVAVRWPACRRRRGWLAPARRTHAPADPSPAVRAIRRQAQAPKRTRAMTQRAASPVIAPIPLERCLHPASQQLLAPWLVAACGARQRQRQHARGVAPPSLG